jgi:hypothetical protein
MQGSQFISANDGNSIRLSDCSQSLSSFSTYSHFDKNGFVCASKSSPEYLGLAATSDRKRMFIIIQFSVVEEYP